MDPSPRYGFKETGRGIHFWFLDREGVATFLGPVISLDHLNDNRFRLQTDEGAARDAGYEIQLIGRAGRLQTAKGSGYCVLLTSEDVAEFRRLGGHVKEHQESAPAIQPIARWGFQKSADGIFLWFRGTVGVKCVGPVVSLEHLGEDRYSLATPNARHPIRLTPDDMVRFRRLGGSVAGRLEGRDAPRPAVLESRVRDVLPAQAHVRPAPVALSARGPGKPFQWRGLGPTVQVGPYAIVDPLTYFSHGAPAEDEASAIDVTLPIGKPIEQPAGALGYWPQYRGISPDQRANYLAWLAGERNGHLNDVGYAFLYFYGLERRILIDKQDINPVTFEVVRLLRRYTFSGSFTGYLSRFLAYVIARTGLEKLREEWFNAIFEESPILPDEEILALALAWHVKRGQPLSAAWAIRLAKQHPQTPRSEVAERAPEQFRVLFTKKYQERYGNGLHPKLARRDRVIQYAQPASPSLIALRNHDPAWAAPVPIPNVLGLQSQFVPLVKVWTECIEDLKAFSRQIAKGVEVNTRAAFEALPPELKTDTEHPDKACWDKVVSEHTTEDGFVVVPISELAAIHGLAIRSRRTPRQSESLAQTAEYVGYCIEPDPRITHRPYGSDELVALFRPEGEPKLPSDKRYASAGIMLELQLAVAAADGDVTQEEINVIGPFLEGQFHLDQAEVRRLKQLERVFLQRRLALSHVTKRLRKALSLQQREMLSRSLLGVAAANGVINQLTVKALRRVYRALGVDVTELNCSLEELQGIGRRGEGASAEEQSLVAETEVGLNQDLVRQIMADTRAVADMLGEVMHQDNEEPGEQTDRPLPNCNAGDPPPSLDPRFPGLQDRFHVVLAELLNRDEWPAVDFESLIRAKGLMPNDAMARINEWAEESLGDLLIEEGNPLLIHRSLTQGRT